MQENQVKRALVAGGAGFLGSHLVDRLLEEGYRVTAVDDLSTGSEDNVKIATQSGYFQFVRGDVVHLTPGTELWEKLNKNYDVVFNFACPASPKAYQSDPIKTMMVNVVGTKNLLDLASVCNATFIQASTSEVYGNPAKDHHPQKEDYCGNVNPVGPRSNYDEGKRAAESLCADYQRLGKLTCVQIARIFNTFGPRMSVNDGRVVSNFVVQFLQNENLTVYGDGTQTRSFCYVDDLINGFIALLKAAPDFNVSSFGPVNLGNPIEIQIVDLVAEISRVVGFSDDELRKFLLKSKNDALPEDDPERRCPNIELAKDMLGWHPNVSLKDGLEKTVAYFKRILST